jgi:CheY-like chemotaxis protein
VNTYKQAVILLVEDDLGDQKLTKQALCGDRVGNELKIVNNAEEAIEYLNNAQQGKPGFPMPDLILLDLNMPGLGGREFLRRQKDIPALEIIPVVVFTTSDSDKDILESFKLQAAGYIRKPANLEGFRETMKDLTDYWFVICRRVEKDSTVLAV